MLPAEASAARTECDMHCAHPMLDWRTRSLLCAVACCMGLVNVAWSSDSQLQPAAVPAVEPRRAAPSAPNIVLILLDDVGFGATSAFGGPVATPELERLAAQGLKYNRFHVTALCSPTRAALLSGRNAHKVGFGDLADTPRPGPGYDAIWNPRTACVAQLLRAGGYSTAAVGKWHNTPVAEISPVGPFDRWPTGLGFEYFYGFMDAAIDHWAPTLYRNTTQVPTPQRADYFLTTDLVDQAIAWIHTHQSLAPNKPYFLYFASGATHEPHEAHQKWIDQFRGAFDAGWDVLREQAFRREKRLGVIPADADLTPRPAELPSWDSLAPDDKRLLARQMEVFAGFLAETDYEIGRLIHAVQEGPGADNTLILYVAGDNGASAEAGPLGNTDTHASLQSQLARLEQLGGPKLHGNYAAGWAWATSAPFQWFKQNASHLGGTRDPLIAVWPRKIVERGAVRAQYTHAVDVAPTLLEVAGLKAPPSVEGVPQIPFDGISFAYSFEDGSAPSRHMTQFFEQRGNRSIYHAGWLAAARHSVPWIETQDENFSADRWELYDLDTDFSEAHDLAGSQPEKLAELQRLFDREAHDNGALPLGNAAPWHKRTPDPASAPGSPTPTATFYAGFQAPTEVMPQAALAYRLLASVRVPQGDVSGVLISNGSNFLYVRNRRLVYETLAYDAASHTGRRIAFAGRMGLPSGAITVGYSLKRTSDGTTQIELIANGVSERVGVASPFNRSGTFAVGRYVAFAGIDTPHMGPFQGEISSVTITIE